MDDGEAIKSPQAKETSPSTENQERLKRLADAFDTLFNAQMGGAFARNGEPGFSGDAASLFTLVALPAESGTTPALAKAGWGEFSRNTFESGQYPAFQQFPLELYCVSQHDSYFAGNDQRRQMEEDPARYLAENSLLVAKRGHVTLAERDEHGDFKPLDAPVEPVPYDEMLRIVRNTTIAVKTTPDQFAAFLAGLPDDPKELGKYIADGYREVEEARRKTERYADMPQAIRDKDTMLYLLTGMGINTVGSRVGDVDSMNSILELKRQFDFENKAFK